ncbi:MAG: AraC family transcriptional regulator [candidate division Zixibacteria bacterium]|nr:AraC family transcriptional regulator [candidate division Zixibacteria bacterium]
MDYVFEKINIPSKHSFIARKIELDERLPIIHSHKNFELNFIVSGAGRRIVGNDISSFEDNDLVLLGPEIPHCWEILESKTNTPPTCITIHFYENIIRSDFFNIPELEGVVKLLKKADKGISFKGKEVKKVKANLVKLVNMNGLESYINLLNVFNQLIHIGDFEYLTETLNYSAHFTKDLGQINRVYEYVFLHIEEGIKLKKVAEQINMAPGSFCRYFKKKTNLTFMEYVKKVRIGLAAKMLIETEKSVTQICFDSGYNTLANFNHYFRSVMDCTPSEYRKLHR